MWYNTFQSILLWNQSLRNRRIVAAELKIINRRKQL